MKVFRFLKNVVLVLFFFLVLGSYNFKSDVWSAPYDCTSWGLYCQSPGGVLDSVWGYGVNYIGQPTCVFLVDETYVCWGNDAECSGGITYYWTKSDCIAHIDSQFAGCCGVTPSCTPGCTPSCSEGYSKENPGGDVDTETVSCTDDCGDPFSDTCYISCSGATCEDYGYLDSCPVGETCRELPAKSLLVNGEIYGDCPTEYETICYDINTPPDMPEDESELDLLIIPGNYDDILTSYIRKDPSPLLSKIVNKIFAQEPDSILGFTSITHSGTDLNNPLKIWAEFSDTDGTEDIVAIYVWWSKDETGSFTTPNRIADPTEGLSVKTESGDFWGFMVRRIAGNWSKVYAPYIGEGDAAWVEIGDMGGEKLDPILASDGISEMVEIYGLEVTDIPADHRVELEFLFNFLENSSSVSEVQYTVWSLANDVDGFLPFEEYEEVEDIIIDYDHWVDSTKDWNIDLTKPGISNEVVADVEEKIISIDFDTSDNLSLSYVRLDACRTPGISTDVITPTLNGTVGDDYTLSDCQSDDPVSNSDIIENLDLLGSSGAILGATDNYSPLDLKIDLNNNEGGAITFWITTMDLAGNYTQAPIIYELGEWAMTTDGLVYGTNGVSSTTRNIEDDVWDPLSNLFDYGFDEPNADLTDEVLLGGNSAVNLLQRLVKYVVNKSFKASNFPGVYINSPYAELLTAYNVKKENPLLSYQEVTDLSISDNLTTLCDENKEYCIINNNGNTTISPFVCDGKGLIIVNGDVTITPDLTNDTALDACIILASGNITILKGSDQIDSGLFGYDLLHAFLITDGEIIIGSDSNNDGLLVEGGLVAFTPNAGIGGAIVNDREMQLPNRNIYPVLVVNNNAKYGLLSRTLFGSQIDVFKVEVGFKPY